MGVCCSAISKKKKKREREAACYLKELNITFENTE